jgi:hypothetical protein
LYHPLYSARSFFFGRPFETVIITILACSA